LLMSVAPVAAVSSSVEANLVRALQTDLDGLRAENREVSQRLQEEQDAHARSTQQNVALGLEVQRLREQLEMQEQLAREELEAAVAAERRRLQQRGSEATPAPPARQTLDGSGELLEREVCNALSEALESGQDGDERWESVAGAARRRTNKTSSTIAAAAVRVARRAQAAWAAEHARLREEALAAHRKGRSRLAELDECRAVGKRLKAELSANRRALNEAREEIKRLQLHAQFSLGALAAPAPAAPHARLSARAQNEAPPEARRSQFAVYMEARHPGCGTEADGTAECGGSGGGGAGAGAGAGTGGYLRLPKLPGSASAALPPQETASDTTEDQRERSWSRTAPQRPLQPKGAMPAAGGVPASSHDSVRSMSEALQRRWQAHVHQHTEGAGGIGQLPQNWRGAHHAVR
jgi:hypothetical protein